MRACRRRLARNASPLATSRPKRRRILQSVEGLSLTAPGEDQTVLSPTSSPQALRPSPTLLEETSTPCSPPSGLDLAPSGEQVFVEQEEQLEVCELDSYVQGLEEACWESAPEQVRSMMQSVFHTVRNGLRQEAEDLHCSTLLLRDKVLLHVAHMEALMGAFSTSGTEDASIQGIFEFEADSS